MIEEVKKLREENEHIISVCKREIKKCFRWRTIMCWMWGTICFFNLVVPFTGKFVFWAACVNWGLAAWSIYQFRWSYNRYSKDAKFYEKVQRECYDDRNELDGLIQQLKGF
jgi:hypothetical protein